MRFLSVLFSFPSFTAVSAAFVNQNQSFATSALYTASPADDHEVVPVNRLQASATELGNSSCGNDTFPDGGRNATVTECERELLLLHAPTFDPSTMTRVIVLSAITVLSLVGNTATVWSISRNRRQNTSTVYFLISHLAVADLMVTLFCIFAEAVWTSTVQWYAGNAMCKIVKFFQVFSLYLSTFILIVIGFDRMCAVRYPMKRMHARHHVRRSVAGVWALSALLSVPQLFIFSVQKGPFVEEFYQCVTYGFYSAPWQEQIYISMSLFFMFVLPLTTLIITYICTFCSISSEQALISDRLVRSPLEDVRRKIIRKAKAKSLMITVVIVLAFVVCWTPYYVMMIIFIFLDPDEQLSEELQSAIFFFGSSTALINPLIYGAFHLNKTKSRRTRSAMKNSSSSALSTRIDTSSVIRVAYYKRENGVCLHGLQPKNQRNVEGENIR